MGKPCKLVLKEEHYIYNCSEKEQKRQKIKELLAQAFYEIITKENNKNT